MSNSMKKNVSKNKTPSKNNSKDQTQISPTAGVRLSKVMSERGLCSRREADAWIAQGWVSVNGRVIQELGTRIDPQARIELSPQAQQEQDSLITIILNKPIGWVSAQPEKGYRPAIELLSPENHVDFNSAKDTGLHASLSFEDPRRLSNLAVAGRLDIDSQGILIFTQDGRLAKHLIGENSPVEKEYLVRTPDPVSREQIIELGNGTLELDGHRLKKAVVEKINEDQLRVVLTEGRKRQIRRMFELVGLRVTGLKRVRTGRLRLGRLPEGKWRYLGTDERI